MINYAEISNQIDIPAALTKYVRGLARVPNSETLLIKVGEDIFYTDNVIQVHVDTTEKGKHVFGVVLLNDADLLLYSEGRLFDIPPGTLYHIDGRRPHAALPVNNIRGIRASRFAAMIWDLPRSTTIERFKREAIERLNNWKNT